MAQEPKSKWGNAGGV